MFSRFKCAFADAVEQARALQTLILDDNQGSEWVECENSTVARETLFVVGPIGAGQLAHMVANNRAFVLRTLSLQNCDIFNCVELAYG